MWLGLFDIKESTFHRIKKSIVASFDFVRDTHGSVAEQRELQHEACERAKRISIRAGKTTCRTFTTLSFCGWGGQFGLVGLLEYSLLHLV